MEWSPMMWLSGVCVAAAVAAGCVAEAPTPDGPPPTAAPSESTDRPASVEPVGFVDVVWRVAESPQVQRGQLYVFLSTGALVVASDTGTPIVGSWTERGGRLATMTEEGVTYQVEVLSLDARQFRFRSLNPGQPVELTLERATSQ